MSIPGIDELIDAIATELGKLLAGDLGNYRTKIEQYVADCQRIGAQVSPRGEVLVSAPGSAMLRDGERLDDWDGEQAEQPITGRP